MKISVHEIGYDVHLLEGIRMRCYYDFLREKVVKTLGAFSSSKYNLQKSSLLICPRPLRPTLIVSTFSWPRKWRSRRSSRSNWRALCSSAKLVTFLIATFLPSSRSSAATTTPYDPSPSLFNARKRLINFTKQMKHLHHANTTDWTWRFRTSKIEKNDIKKTKRLYTCL